MEGQKQTVFAFHVPKEPENAVSSAKDAVIGDDDDLAIGDTMRPPQLEIRYDDDMASSKPSPSSAGHHFGSGPSTATSKSGKLLVNAFASGAQAPPAASAVSENLVAITGNAPTVVPILAAAATTASPLQMSESAALSNSQHVVVPDEASSALARSASRVDDGRRDQQLPPQPQAVVPSFGPISIPVRLEPMPQQQQQQQYQQQPPPQQHGQPRYSHQGGPKPRPLPLPYPDAFGTSDRPLEDMLLESKRYVDFVSSVPLEQVMAWYRQNHVGSIVPPYTTPGVEQTGVERRQVFVGQLPSYLTEEGLTACLEYVYGTPNSVAFTLIRRSASQRTAPYGLVTLTSPQLVDAFRGLNRSIYVGRQNLFFANRLDQAAYTLEGNTEFQRFVSQLVECDMSRHVADQRTLGYARAAMVVGLANPPPRLTRAPQQGQHQAQQQGRGYGGAPNAYAAPSTHGATHAAPPSYHQPPDLNHQPPHRGAPRNCHHQQPHHQQHQQPHYQQHRAPPPHQQHHAYATPAPGPYSHAPPPPPPPSYHPPQYHAPPQAPLQAAAPNTPYGYTPPPALQQHSHNHPQQHSLPTTSPTAPIATLSLRQAATTGPLYMMNADGHLVPVQVVGSNNPSPTVSPCNRHDGAPEVFGLLRPGGDRP